MDYYSVTAKFGHVGRNNYIYKTIPVKAESAKEAAYDVRWMPRVKHHCKDVIKETRRISGSEYLLLVEKHRNDPYFKVKSKQEQRKLCPQITDEVQHNVERVSKKELREQRKDRIKYIRMKNQIIINEAMLQSRHYDIQTI